MPGGNDEIQEDRLLEEVVADKGYHSNEVLWDLSELEIRSYISEPDRGRWNWKGKPRCAQDSAGRLLEGVFAHGRRLAGRLVAAYRLLEVLGRIRRLFRQKSGPITAA